ncbi:MAG TPA: VWA domain-containing protein [Terriglobia bacterium]|jgi:Ca-activated chloride channel family protein|nr:VWA domain-containing protein [Terriglobia bacterium]
MKSIKYSKYVGFDWDSLSLEELLNKLSDYLLQSGFYNDYYGYPQTGQDHNLQDLHDAILDALLNQGVFSDEMLEKFMQLQPDERDARLAELVRELVKRLVEEGYISFSQDAFPEEGGVNYPGQGFEDLEAAQVKFELTNKSLDFLGFKTLKDLLGSLGKSHIGRHDTRDLSTGIESSGASKPYEFGDTLNLDVSGTLLSAVQREGLGVPLNVDYKDLMIHQTEYQSSCATVVMLDCSHSMILYGEDRFTPAKKVAMALSHLIRTQYPGDTLNLVLFHDSAEEVPLSQLARVQVGPYYTNTREGLRLAQRILGRQRKDMKQIIMITDGKPSALTQENGRIYKNAFGLDPHVVSETIREVANCRKAGIMINTFMLARDYELVSFVKKVTEICRGKAYFTTPYTLGQYLLMDYMQKKVKTIH